MRALLPVRHGERWITAIMFSYVFGVLTFYYILDPLRKSLFLSSIPSQQLPFAYLLTAVFAGAIATLTFKLARYTSAITILTATNIVLIGTVLYFRWSIGQAFWYSPWMFFVYVKIVSVLSTAQFWMLAGYIYDNRQAKRIYAVLGAGAGIGAVTGSYVGGFLRGSLSVSSMMLICAAIGVMLIVLSQIAWRFRKTEVASKARSRQLKPTPERFSDLWRMIFSSRHLRLMVVLIFLTFIASQIADWQVDNLVQQAYQSLPKLERELRIGEFSARLSFVTNILSIVFQVAVTGLVVRRLGVMAAIGFLPVCLFFSSFGILLFPSLLTAAIARGSDTVSRYSLNRAGLELLYLPLSPIVRKKLKVFVDVFVDRAGRGAAAFVILAFTSSYLPLGVRGTVAVAIVLTFVCVLLCFALKKSYVDSFRQQLNRRDVELAEIPAYVTDPAAVLLLLSTLEGSNERQMLYSLQLLQSVRAVDFSSQLLPLLDHPSPYVREEALRTLHALLPNYSTDAERLLGDLSTGVRFAAIEYLCTRDPRGALLRLESLLDDPRADVRVSAARWAAEYAVPGFAPSMKLIARLMGVAGPGGGQARAAAAALALRLSAAERREVVQRLLKDPDPEVAAMASITAGKSGQTDVLFNIIQMLSKRRWRAGAKDALLCYGEGILGTLGDVLRDRSGDPILRRQVAWIIGRIPVSRSAALLAEQLEVEDPLLRHRVVQSLNHLHTASPGLPKAGSLIRGAIQAEARSYYVALSVCHAIDGEVLAASTRLLCRAVRERMDQHLEILFRLLGLAYSQKEMHSAYLAFKGKERRLAAIEFLDNVLNHDEKAYILPLLEQSSPEELLRRGRFGIKELEHHDALRMLSTCQDAWLRTCALQVIEDGI